MLSSSVRESFHMGLVEAVASGALPVVRDWPFFPGAARTLFPPDWVVDSPAEAAAADPGAHGGRGHVVGGDPGGCGVRDRTLGLARRQAGVRRAVRLPEALEDLVNTHP